MPPEEIPQSPTPTPTENPNPNPTPSVEAAPAAPPAAPAGAPESYAAFTAPEGKTLDAKSIEAATPLFKELGLTQAQAQKLIDFQTNSQASAAEAQLKAVTDMRQGWRDAVAKDPVLGGRETEIKAEVGKALAQLDPKVTSAFREAMDFTGAGDHPAFIRAFYDLAKMVNEGTHVAAGRPAPAGQSPNGIAARPSAAQAMYPSLPQ